MLLEFESKFHFHLYFLTSIFKTQMCILRNSYSTFFCLGLIAVHEFFFFSSLEGAKNIFSRKWKKKQISKIHYIPNSSYYQDFVEDSYRSGVCCLSAKDNMSETYIPFECLFYAPAPAADPTIGAAIVWWALVVSELKWSQWLKYLKELSKTRSCKW